MKIQTPTANLLSALLSIDEPEGDITKGANCSRCPFAYTPVEMTAETFVRLRDEALASEGGESSSSSSEITRKVWLEAIGGPKRGGKIYPFDNQGGAPGLVPKGSSGVPLSFMHSQMPESFERMVLQLEEANTMNNWLKEQLTTSAQHEQRMHDYYTSAISTVFLELGLAMTRHHLLVLFPNHHPFLLMCIILILSMLHLLHNPMHMMMMMMLALRSLRRIRLISGICLCFNL
ncbi:hypothetical protein Dimus_015282 [Dionaea muscipula]